MLACPDNSLQPNQSSSYININNSIFFKCEICDEYIKYFDHLYNHLKLDRQEDIPSKMVLKPLVSPKCPLRLPVY